MVSQVAHVDGVPNSKQTISARKLAANRANALRSTGPRSAEGKARARRNATRHGQRAQLPPDGVPAFDLVDDSAPGSYRAIRHALRADVRPDGALEELLVERLARSAWRMRLADAAEVELLDLAQLDRAVAARRCELDQRQILQHVKATGRQWEPARPTAATGSPGHPPAASSSVSAPTAGSRMSDPTAGAASPAVPTGAASEPSCPIEEPTRDEPTDDEAFFDHFDDYDTPAIATAEQFRKPERECELLRLAGYQVRLEGSFRAAIRELRSLRKERAKWAEEEDVEDDDVADRAAAFERFDEEVGVDSQPLAASQANGVVTEDEVDFAQNASVDEGASSVPVEPVGEPSAFAPSVEVPAPLVEVAESNAADFGGDASVSAPCRAAGAAKPQAAATNQPTAAARVECPQAVGALVVNACFAPDAPLDGRANEPTDVATPCPPGGTMRETPEGS